MESEAEDDQKEPERRLQEDDETNESEGQKDKNMGMKDLKICQQDKRTISPLSLLKEDFSQLKEEVLKAFKDKDTKTELEDRPSSQAENKAASSTLGLLKEDFNQFKEDLSNVFRIGLSKERDAVKEDSSHTFKIKDSKAERTNEPFKSLFRRDQKTCQKAENSQGAKKTFSETSEEQLDGGFRGSLSEQKEETVNELDKTETASLSETQQSEESIPASQAAKQKCEGGAEDERINDEEDEESLWESLSSPGLFSLRHPNKDNRRDQPGDELWWVKNFACYLTFDPNTANSELLLSDCNRMATRVWSDRQTLDHPDRFERCPQVLCREGLLDSVYWEVVWSGGADIGVTYNSISRDGDTASCLLGHNQQSWSLECSEGSYTPCHDNKRFRASSPRPFTHRVGVYLNWSVGSLSFYAVSQDTMVHLHTFTSTFSEPLYPAFWVWAYDGSVLLSHVELAWERLL
uniref:E3 ubiquitin-protein ligase RNF135-like isoform X2 n=1 Tax=Scatophagus argus TaxID=75038 RepID=UPI001ED7FCB2|nr:E3 ubiquitin-protein ligase RNF135-like isoform X2 [Scatophagus argus]